MAKIEKISPFKWETDSPEALPSTRVQLSPFSIEVRQNFDLVTLPASTLGEFLPTKVEGVLPVPASNAQAWFLPVISEETHMLRLLDEGLETTEAAAHAKELSARALRRACIYGTRWKYVVLVSTVIFQEVTIGTGSLSGVASDLPAEELDHLALKCIKEALENAYNWFGGLKDQLPATIPVIQ